MRTRTLSSVASVAAIVMAVALWPASASAAGPVRTLQQLQSKIRTGNELTVVDRGGATYVGKLVRVSESELTIETAAGPRTFSAGDLVRIDCRRRGPLWNGALIGAVAGAIPGIGLMVAGEDDRYCYGSCGMSLWTGLGLLSIGVGTATGTLIDLAKAGNVKVFEAAPKSARTFTVAPVLSSARKGVMFQVGW
jgi:hypothetical protein